LAKNTDSTPSEKLEEFGRSILNDVKKGSNPRFITAVRSRSNVVYEDKEGYLTLGGARRRGTS
jgi:hypothetical protein